jgi:hypothetical protein
MKWDPTGQFGMLLASFSSYDSIVQTYGAVRVPADFFKQRAWDHIHAHWRSSDEQDFRKYIADEAPRIAESGVNLTCAEVAVTLLINYASEHGLPVVLKGINNQMQDSRSSTVISQNGFLDWARRNVPSHELYNLNTFEKGALPGKIGLAEAGDLLMRDAIVWFGWLAFHGHTRIFLENRSGQIRYVAGNMESGQASDVVENELPLDKLSTDTPSLRWWEDFVFGR